MSNLEGRVWWACLEQFAIRNRTNQDWILGAQCIQVRWMVWLRLYIVQVSWRIIKIILLFFKDDRFE